ncbi:MAG: cupin domain-containing protein [Gluconacetobacter diazotrophicus]|nr:cupin domain-containing protein [Gluconacetobacter diazotrophicus]
MSSSKHVRSLTRADTLHSSALGSVSALTAREFPLLAGLSIKRVVLKPGAAREPHWHANAHELTYCAAGAVLVTVIDNKDAVATFTVAAGQMFFAANGSLHGFENLGEEDAVLVVAFSHERPSDFSLRATFGSMTDAVLGNTFGLPAERLATVERDRSNPYLVPVVAHPVPDTARFADPHRFDLGEQQPPVDFPYGTARVARSQFWPILRNIAMYRIDVPDSGMREVHWHPETAEMGYVHAGRARMTILDPDGSVDTYELEPGDVYFIPRGYPHHIEVLDERISFLIFFDQPMPGDIGLRLVGSGVSRPLLAASLGVEPDRLPPFPPIVADPLIVERINPRDPG